MSTGTVTVPGLEPDRAARTPRSQDTCFSGRSWPRLKKKGVRNASDNERLEQRSKYPLIDTVVGGVRFGHRSQSGTRYW